MKKVKYEILNVVNGKEVPSTIFDDAIRLVTENSETFYIEYQFIEESFVKDGQIMIKYEGKSFYIVPHDSFFIKNNIEQIEEYIRIKSIYFKRKNLQTNHLFSYSIKGSVGYEYFEDHIEIYNKEELQSELMLTEIKEIKNQNTAIVWINKKGDDFITHSTAAQISFLKDFIGENFKNLNWE